MVKMSNFQSNIYRAARDGNLSDLKIAFGECPIEEIRDSIGRQSNDVSLLLVAAKNGHYKIVEYLLNEWDVNIEQVGTVVFDGETIDDAPPLWCAAAAGHLQVLELLISHGANINKTTATNSTPLRAACFDGHFDVVRYLVTHQADLGIANRHGHTCLMIACYKGYLPIVKYLLEHGADVNTKSKNGNTALHDCAESGRLGIMKLLLEHGAEMDGDIYGVTPLIAAAMNGHGHIVEFLHQLPEITRKERIDSLEMLGATSMDKNLNMMLAVSYWKRAMNERFSKGLPPIRKLKYPSILTFHEKVEEPEDMEELEDFIADPDKLRILSLLVRERILGSGHFDTTYYIRHRGALYAEAGDFKKCIRLWLCALELQQRTLEPLSPTIQNTYASFAELFSFMLAESSQGTMLDFFNNIDLVFCSALFELERASDNKESQQKDLSPHFHRLMNILVHIMRLVCHIKNFIPPERLNDFKRMVYQLVRMNLPTRSGWTVLHHVCLKEKWNMGQDPFSIFPTTEVVKLLLEVGANPNIFDEDFNTPLHVATIHAHTLSGRAVVNILLKNGAHLDYRNKQDESPMDTLEKEHYGREIFKYRSLQCLAARVIKLYGVVYHGHLAPFLETFVDRH